MFIPRDYQETALNGTFDYINNREGNPLIAMPTGSGKAAIVGLIIHRANTQYPACRSLVLSHTKELLVQDHDELRNIWPDAPAGFFSAGLGKKQPHLPIVFGGIGSVINAIPSIGFRNLVIIDEAHLVSPNGNGNYLTAIRQLKKINPYLKVIGLTATKFRMGQGLLTDGGEIFTDIAVDMTTPEYFQWFISNGYLVPPIPQKTRTVIDTSAVTTSNGEFNLTELQEASDRYEITFAAAQEACYYGANRRSWITFCSGVEHAEHAAEIFNRMGIDTAFVHSKMSKGDRDKAIADWKAGRVRNITNNGILCLDEETEILTDKGWTDIDAMSYSHRIAAWNYDGSIDFTHPKFIVRRERRSDEKMVAVKGYQKDFRVTSNHQMINKRGYYGKWRKDDAINIVAKHIKMPTAGIAIPFRYEKYVDDTHWTTINARIAVLKCKYRKQGMEADKAFEKAKLTVNVNLTKLPKAPHQLTSSECEFIGFWLGDGTLTPRCEFSQSKVYPNIIEWFDIILSKTNFAHSKNEINGNIRWSIARGTGSQEQARESGYYIVEPYLKKDGTELFWGLDETQFEALMHGFWMADGNHGKEADINIPTGSGIVITGTQKVLYDLLQAIGVCRGFTISITKQSSPKISHHKQQWAISWQKRTTIEFLRERAIIETEAFKTERVWCVTSTSENIVTRRNGKVLVTGNTTGVNNPMCDMLVGLRATKSPGLWVQIVGRTMRPYPGKTNALILDFAANSKEIGTIDDPRIPKRKGEGNGEIPVKICDHCGVYNHISARFCAGCFEPFDIQVKISTRSDDSELLSSDIPAVQYFDVGNVVYKTHKNFKTGNETIKVSYVCGDKVWNEHLSFNDAEGYAGKKARDFWRQRAGDQFPPPTSCKLALGSITYLKRPKRIRVWVNAQPYPQVLSHEF